MTDANVIVASVVSGESHVGVITREMLPTVTSVMLAQVIGSSSSSTAPPADPARLLRRRRGSMAACPR